MRWSSAGSQAVQSLFVFSEGSLDHRSSSFNGGDFIVGFGLIAPSNGNGNPRFGEADRHVSTKFTGATDDNSDLAVQIIKFIEVRHLNLE